MRMELFGLFLGTIISANANAGSLECGGRVNVRDERGVSESSARVKMGESTLAGAIFHIGSPITEDFEFVVRWRIAYSAVTDKGLEIIAVDESMGGRSRLSFYLRQVGPGKVRLADFKGFENSTPFGPNDLDCVY